MTPTCSVLFLQIPCIRGYLTYPANSACSVYHCLPGSCIKYHQSWQKVDHHPQQGLESSVHPVSNPSTSIHNYPLVNMQKTMENQPCSMGKSTISMVIFNSYFDITRGYITLRCRLGNPQTTRLGVSESPALWLKLLLVS